MISPVGKKGRVYILLPGIRSQTADAKNWAPQMATDINLYCQYAKGDEYRYFASALLHRLKLEEHAGQVSDLARRYWIAGYEPILAAHSDGCEIARRVIVEGPAIFRAVHFFSAACDNDFATSGLNEALRKGKVGELILHTSKGDGVLNILARNSKRFFSWLGVAYGTLGFDGPKNLAEDQAHKVTVDQRQGFDHSDWFNGANWEETRREITALENFHEN